MAAVAQSVVGRHEQRLVVGGMWIVAVRAIQELGLDGVTAHRAKVVPDQRVAPVAQRRLRLHEERALAGSVRPVIGGSPDPRPSWSFSSEAIFV